MSKVCPVSFEGSLMFAEFDPKLAFQVASLGLKNFLKTEIPSINLEIAVSCLFQIVYHHRMKTDVNEIYEINQTINAIKNRFPDLSKIDHKKIRQDIGVGVLDIAIDFEKEHPYNIVALTPCDIILEHSDPSLRSILEDDFREYFNLPFHFKYDNEVTSEKPNKLDIIMED
jgi:hypothetical protein